MARLSVGALVLTLSFAVSMAHAEQRSRGGEAQRSGRSPGGEWSERTHGGNQVQGQRGNQERAGSGNAGAAAGLGARKNNQQISGNEKAVGGAAAANRRSPQASGAQGAAAGAAAANRNSPQASGAQGAAAGAAAANRNSPQASGAQGAAAGAAAANRNSPQATGAEGAAAGAAVANRNQPDISGAAGYAAVRSSFDHPNVYGQQWYGDHPGAWSASSWTTGTAWSPSTWGAVAGYCGYGNATPVSYNYGVNVTSQDGNVSVNGQNVGTNEEYSQQAAALAQTGTDAQTSDTDAWMPLGVFAMVRNANQHPQLIVQLAINKQGILRGNYTDELTDHVSPVHGAVDKQTQRAAWTVGDNKQTVMEAGLSDLTDGEAPALIHKNGKTDHWILVRLEQSQPDGAGNGNASGGTQ